MKMPSNSAIGPESRLAVTTSRLISLETTMREQEQKSPLQVSSWPQLVRSSYSTHYRARTLFQRLPRISLLWTLIAQDCQLFWRVCNEQANTNPHTGLEGEPLVSVRS